MYPYNWYQKRDLATRDQRQITIRIKIKEIFELKQTGVTQGRIVGLIFKSSPSISTQVQKSKNRMRSSVLEF